MRTFGILFSLVGSVTLVFAGSVAVAGPVDQPQISAKSKYAKCRAKRTSKAKKLCRRKIRRQARIRRQAKQTLWVDYAGTASRRPQTIVFGDYSMGPGPVVSNLRWKKWGYSRASAEGDYSEPTMPGYPPSTGSARIVALNPVRCQAQFGAMEGKLVRVYTQVALTYRTAAEVWAGVSGTTRDISGLAGRQVCVKPPAG